MNVIWRITNHTQDMTVFAYEHDDEDYPFAWGFKWGTKLVSLSAVNKTAGGAIDCATQAYETWLDCQERREAA